MSKSLRLYSVFMACGTLFLVLAGGMVTSTGSALAVPDWPLSFGQFFPKMEGGVFYEHGHRMVAATIGFLTIILAVWLWRQAQEPLLKRAGWIALGMVCVQGLLGGVTVLLKLPAVTSVGHACLGQLFFSWVCCMAVMVWSEPHSSMVADVRKLRRLGLMTVGFAFYQVLFGAIYRHTGMLLHMHFLGAPLVLVHAILLHVRVRKTASADAWLSRPAVLLLGLVCGQMGLGLYTWQRPSIPNATAHVVVGALIVATASVFALQSFRRTAS